MSLRGGEQEHETCPHCQADLRGAPIAEENRHYYASLGATPEEVERDAPRFYSRKVGVEIPEAYDGVLFWQCPDCGHRWHRFAVNSDLYERARRYVEGRDAS